MPKDVEQFLEQSVIYFEIFPHRLNEVTKIINTITEWDKIYYNGYIMKNNEY